MFTINNILRNKMLKMRLTIPVWKLLTIRKINAFVTATVDVLKQQQNTQRGSPAITDDLHKCHAVSV